MGPVDVRIREDQSRRGFEMVWQPGRKIAGPGRTKTQPRPATAFGRMQIPVLLDRSRREPLTGQLVEQLRDAIRHARIRPGTRLPSSRRLSEQLEVSRNTVIRAYDALIVEGFRRSPSGLGNLCCRQSAGYAVKAAASTPEPARAGALSHMPLPPLPLRVQNVVDQRRKPAVVRLLSR